MGATRALVTVRMGITYVNDRELAAQHLAKLRMVCKAVVVDDEITQRLSVVEAGMRVQKAVGGSFTTPLAEAISALRKLNNVVNVVKHFEIDEGYPQQAPVGSAAKSICSDAGGHEDSHEIVLGAVKKNGNPPEYAAPELKTDLAFVLEAVSRMDVHLNLRHQSKRRTVRSCRWKSNLRHQSTRRHQEAQAPCRRHQWCITGGANLVRRLLVVRP